METARIFELDELAREMHAADEARAAAGRELERHGTARARRRGGEAHAAAAALQVELSALAERLQVAHCAHAASAEDERDEQAALLLLQRVRNEAAASQRRRRMTGQRGAGPDGGHAARRGAGQADAAERRAASEPLAVPRATRRVITDTVCFVLIIERRRAPCWSCGE